MKKKFSFDYNLLLPKQMKNWLLKQVNRSLVRFLSKITKGMIDFHHQKENNQAKRKQPSKKRTTKQKESDNQKRTAERRELKRTKGDQKANDKIRQTVKTICQRKHTKHS